MESRRQRRTATLAICLLLPHLLASSREEPDAPEGDDEAAVRALLESYYQATAATELDRAVSCWSPESPQRASKIQELKARFAQTGPAVVTIRDVRRLRIEGDKASCRVELEAAPAGKREVPPERFLLDLECVRDGGGWTIWREEVAQIALAARLAELGSKGEREALLEAESELKSPSLCRALVWRGDRLVGQADYSRARELFELCRGLAREIGDRGSEAAALSGMADTLAPTGELDRALELARQSLTLREQVGERAAIATGLIRLGFIYRSRDELDSALECYRKSLSIRSELGNRYGVASAYREIGVVHYLQGNYTEALDQYGRSLELFEGLQDKPEIAQTLYNIGVVHRALADYDRAVECYGGSLRIRQEIGDRLGVAGCLLGLASLHTDRGNLARGLNLNQESLEIRKALGDRLGVALALQGMANIYQAMGHADRAVAFNRDSLAIYREMGQKRPVASSLINIGYAYSVLRDYDAALDHYRQALALYGELEDKTGIAKVLGNTGLVFLRRNEAKKALDPLGRSLALSEQQGNRLTTSLTLGLTAWAHRELGDGERAVSLARRAADLARAVRSPLALWQACTSLGDAYRALHRYESSRESFEEAVQAVEALRGEVAGSESERAGFLANMISPYHGLVELEVDQMRAESALWQAERAKGRTLLEVLKYGREDLDSVLTDSEREAARKRVNAVTSLSSRLSREVRSQRPDQVRIAALKADLERARLERDAFEANSHAAHPELRLRRGEVPPLTTAEAARLLPDATGAALEFVVTERTTYLFIVTRGLKENAGVRVYPIPAGREELESRILGFRRQIAERDLGFRTSAAGLFDLLLGPARADLKGRASLVIVPDGPLWDLPFQALVCGGRYLWEQSEVSYVPSLTVLSEMTELRRRRVAARQGPGRLLAMGNPSAGGPSGPTPRELAEGGSLPQLPEAEEQVRRIGGLYGSGARVYVGADASEERFKNEAGDYGIIHLATHGILADTNPLYSHVLMSHGSEEDGELEAREILRLRLNADLVVLSACETARGRVGAGEGMIGLSWALFVAGCPTAIVSQWKVDAAATTALMVEFHRRLLAGTRMSKAASLRAAALETMRDPRYRHPFYWAGFILVGESF